jgi:hypothetical protein
MNICGENNVEFIEGRTIIFSNATIHHISVITINSETRNFFFNASGFQHHVEKEDFETVKTFSFTDR